MQIEKRNYVCSFEESFEGRFLERLWCVSGFGRFRASKCIGEGGLARNEVSRVFC